MASSASSRMRCQSRNSFSVMFRAGRIHEVIEVSGVQAAALLYVTGVAHLERRLGELGGTVPTFDVCDGKSVELLEAELCLDELSKDARGELSFLDAERHECREDGCLTLRVQHALALELTSHTCDSKLGSLFDGRLVSKDLVSVFVAGSGERRGMHTGTFWWRSGAGIVQGRLSGMTNEGTHREPAFDPCQRCDQRGVMEGRLCGQVVRPYDPSVAGAQVFGAYRLRFDPSEGGGQGAVAGTVEGLVVRACGTDHQCVTFDVVGEDANPRSIGGLTVETRDLNGPTPVTSVVTWGATTGLHLWHSSTLTFAQPVSRVELTLVHFAAPATANAFDASGAVVATATMTVPQQVPETLVLSAPGITSVVVESPQDEVLMPSVCWQL
jgi:hypothetical protein